MSGAALSSLLTVLLGFGTALLIARRIRGDEARLAAGALRLRDRSSDRFHRAAQLVLGLALIALSLIQLAQG